MIILDVEQGSRAWIEARLGIPTASEFSRIVTPGGKLSASRDEYIGTILAEWALGEEDVGFQDEWTERGKLLEPEARDFYRFHRDADVQPVGFIYRDEARSVGASPDGVVGEAGLLELKVPKAATHLRWLAVGTIPRQHSIQVQGQLWVSGRAWVDFMSYHPGLPPLIVRAEPDEKLQVAFDEAIPAFIGELMAGREKLREMGVVPAGEIEPELDPIEELVGANPWRDDPNGDKS